MYSYGTFMLIYGKNYHNIVIFLQLKDKYSFKKKKKEIFVLLNSLLLI